MSQNQEIVFATLDFFACLIYVSSSLLKFIARTFLEKIGMPQDERCLQREIEREVWRGQILAGVILFEVEAANAVP